MPRCGCSGTRCACVLTAGAGVAITGAGTAGDPWEISADGGGGGVSGWSPGDLKDTTATTTPAGWLEALGQAVSRITHAALFAAIGTTWGPGDGFSTFNLPNFTGKVRVGVGAGYAMAAGGGATSVQLTVANLPPHTHTMVHTHSIAHDHPAFATLEEQGGHNHTGDIKIVTDGIGKDEAGNNANSAARGPGAGNATAAPVAVTAGGQHQHTINVPPFAGNSGGSSAAATGSTGSASPFSVMQPYRAVRVLIKT